MSGRTAHPLSYQQDADKLIKPQYLIDRVYQLDEGTATPIVVPPTWGSIRCGRRNTFISPIRIRG